MNKPLLPPIPPFHPEEEPIEDRERHEFVNGAWLPKHRDEPVTFYDDREGCEFVNGRWVEKNVSAQSDRVGVRLLSSLNLFAEEQQLGLVFGPECGYQCFPDEPRRVRKPDISLVRLGRLPDNRAPRGNIRIAPDLAVEVVSPNDLAEEINVKVMQYLAVGVRLVWVLYPESRSAWAFRAGGAAAWAAGDGELSGEDVVPGFAVRLESLFAGA